jgi:ATP/maltotriose-dependent transcriptional regulator MalT
MNLSRGVVEVRTNEPPLKSLGTGFLVSEKGHVLTCFHVIGDSVSREVYQHVVRLYWPAVQYETLANVQRDISKPELDLAVLRLQDDVPNGVSPLPVGGDIRYGNNFRSLGFRKAQLFEGLDARGTIRHITVRRDRSEGKNTEIIQLYTNEIDHGMSGAPVFDEVQGLVVGIISLRWHTSRQTDGYLAFAIPLTQALESWADWIEPGEATLTEGESGLFRLPPVPKSFFGRHEELRRLQSAVVDENTSLIAILGPGGIGKTVLAARMVREVQKRIEVLWIPVKGSTLTFEEFVWALARRSRDPNLALLVKGSNSVERKIEKTMQFLCSGQYILFLDDFHLVDDPDFHTFLILASNRGCLKIILCSRVRPNLLGSPHLMSIPVELPLGGIKFEPASVFMRRLSDRLAELDQETLRKIWCKSGHGDPVAMKVFAGLTRYYSCNELLNNLPVFDEHLTLWITSIFDELSEEEQTLLLQCSVFRKSIPRDAIKYVYDGSKPDDVLVTLIDRFLVEHTGNGVFQIHDLIKAFCLERENRSARMTHRGAAEYFQSLKSTSEEERVERAVEAHYHLLEARDFESAREVLHDIKDTLFHWCRFDLLEDMINKTTAALPEPDPQWTLELSKVSYRRNEYDRAVQLGQRSMQEFIDAGDRAGIAKAQFWTARVHFFRDEYDQALKALRVSLREYERVGDEVGKAQTLLWMGRIYSYMDDPQVAHDLLQQGQILAKKAGDKKSVADALYWSGRLNCRKGEYDTAERQCADSQTLFEIVGDQVYITYAMLEVGRALTGKGFYSEAIPKFEESLERFIKQSHPYGIAYAQQSLADVAYAQGYWKKAGVLYRESVKGFENVECWYELALALCGLGNVNREIGELAQARRLYQRGMRILNKLEVHTALAEIMLNFAQLQMLLGKYKSALRLCERTLSVFREYEFRASEAQTLQLLGDLKMEKGDYKSAGKSYELCYKIALDIGDEARQAWAILSQAQVLRQTLTANELTQMKEQAQAAKEIFECLDIQHGIKQSREFIDRLPSNLPL